MANNGIVQYYDLLRVESKNDAFISTYSSMYLKGNPCLVPHVQQTDEKVENWILSIASKDKWNLRDVFNIIAWKTEIRPPFRIQRQPAKNRGCD